MDEDEQAGHLGDSLNNGTDESGHESNKISRRKALKRIGLTFGGLSLLGLTPIAIPARLNANLNAMDDPVAEIEGQTSSSSKHRKEVPKICSSCNSSKGTMTYYDDGSAYSSQSTAFQGASSVYLGGGSYGGSLGGS